VEEALARGRAPLVFNHRCFQRAIEDHFDSDQESRNCLNRKGKTDLARQIRSVAAKLCDLHLHPQSAPLDWATRSYAPAAVVGHFSSISADDLIDADVPCLKQWPPLWLPSGAACWASREIPAGGTPQVRHRGVEDRRSRSVRSRSIIEKPKRKVRLRRWPSSAVTW